MVDVVMIIITIIILVIGMKCEEQHRKNELEYRDQCYQSTKNEKCFSELRKK